MKKAMVGIVMGSDSDLPVMKEAAEILDALGVAYEINIISAHRAPQVTMDYAKSAEKRGLQIIIAGAGGAAHLPGIVAALTPLPVIGVPIKSKSLDGLDSLLSIVQMPTGIPVATVAINNAQNAGLLAVQILGIKYPAYRNKIKKFKKSLESKIIQKSKKLTKLGYKNYKV